MKTIIRLSLALFLSVSFINCAFAQTSPLTMEYKKASIDKLNELMINHYVFPEVAKETADHLTKKLSDGHFDEYDDIEGFASALTASVQEINNDKHMRIRQNRPYVAEENSPERMIEEKLDQLNRSRRYNQGFHSLEMLEGNVAYLDLRGFAGMDRGKALADSYMKLMADADAVIIDLSNNGGGSPDMVQYLCSFFFDKKVHLNSLYYREGDRTIEFWTLEDVGGKKLPEIPLFVLTSSRTFSAAEEFSYNMQTRKRATLVGQTTGGGANPGGTMEINSDLYVFIPTGKAVNPITKTNWEGVGVVPEIKTSVGESKEKAHELAKAAAEQYRADYADKYSKAFNSLLAQLDRYETSKSKDQLLASLEKLVKEEVISESDINALGYEYLMGYEKPDVAEAIFYANTILHPNSANVFDSYGEVLMMKGDLKASIMNYQKAVDVAKKNGDRDLEFYQKNLEKVKGM